MGVMERDTGRWAGWLLFGAVLVVGLCDGMYRAAYHLPTVLGEGIDYNELLERGVDHGFRTTPGGLEMSVAPRNIQSLMQQGHGGACQHQWQCTSHLVCRDGVCSFCASDDECRQRNSMRECYNETSDEDGAQPEAECRHKPLFFPLYGSDIFIFFFAFFVVMLAAPTGTGGGGILVPCFLIIGHFSPHSAVPLSKACILGGAVVNNIFNVQRRHPFANRPLIHSELVAILVPSLLAGTIFGVFLNKMSPNWLIILLLVISLSLSTASSAKKALSLYREEVLADKEAGETEKLLSGGGHEFKAKHYSHSFESDLTLTQEHRQILDQESRIDMRWVGVTICLWVVVFVFAFLKETVTECGTANYFLVSFAPMPIILVSCWYLGNKLCERFERKSKVGYQFAEGDIMWTRANARFLPLVGLLVGVAAGALGIAAGTLLGPLLLELGVLPMVSVGTSGFMVLFTSSSTTMQYILLGVLKVDYAVALTIFSMVAAGIGNAVMYWMVKRYNKTWFVVGALAFLIGASTILLGISGIYRLWRSWEVGENMGLQPLCRHFSLGH
mmetsp:Transcript_27209/g.65647  ORF Transcript_27209/g.65647 Transcript_27209/m.65647 type:complete len:557 (-) Transcript_27209:539-2209(-)